MTPFKILFMDSLIQTYSNYSLSSVSYIIVSYRSGREALPADLVAQLGRLCGEPVVAARGLSVWRLPAVEYTAEELAVWKEQHAASMLQMSRMDPGMGPRQ